MPRTWEELRKDIFEDEIDEPDYEGLGSNLSFMTDAFAKDDPRYKKLNEFANALKFFNVPNHYKEEEVKNLNDSLKLLSELNAFLKDKSGDGVHTNYQLMMDYAKEKRPRSVVRIKKGMKQVSDFLDLGVDPGELDKEAGLEDIIPDNSAPMANMPGVIPEEPKKKKKKDKKMPEGDMDDAAPPDIGGDLDLDVGDNFNKEEAVLADGMDVIDKLRERDYPGGPLHIISRKSRESAGMVS